MNARTWTIIGVITVLTICVLCIGAIVLGAFFVLTGTTITQVGRMPITPNVEVQVEEQATYEVVTPAMLEVTNPFGATVVNASDTLVETIQVSMTKTGHGVDTADAEASLEALQINVEENQNRVVLQVEEPVNEQAPRSASVDFRIMVPSQTTVVVDSHAGRITLSGTSGKADLHTEFGEVSVTDFAGGLAVRTGSGRINVRRVGPLPGGDGEVSLTTSFGEVSLEDARTGRVDVTSRSGQVRLTNVRSTGDAELDNEFGEVVWSTGTAGKLVVMSRSGQVQLSDLSLAGEIEVETNFGEIHLASVEAQGYTLTSSSGLITADLVKGEVTIQNQQNDIRITGGDQAILDLQSRTGMLSFRGSLGAGPHSLETDFGDVRLVLPEESAFNVDFETQFGAIESEFEVSVTETAGEKRLSGTVNGGGPEISARTRNGSIFLDSMP